MRLHACSLLNIFACVLHRAVRLTDEASSSHSLVEVDSSQKSNAEGTFQPLSVRVGSQRASNAAVARIRMHVTNGSPRVVKLLDHLGIQPADGVIEGTGKNGRVLLSDVNRFVEENPTARLLALKTEMRNDFVKRAYGFEFQNGTLLRSAFAAYSPHDRVFFFMLEKLGVALCHLAATQKLFSMDHIGLTAATATMKSRTFHADAMSRHLTEWLSSLRSLPAQRREVIGALYPGPTQVIDGIEGKLRDPDYDYNPNNSLAALHGALIGAMALVDFGQARQAALNDFKWAVPEAKKALLPRRGRVRSSPEQKRVLHMLVGPVRPDLVAEVWRRTTDLETVGDAVLTFLLIRRLLPICADGSELHRARTLLGENAFLALRMLRRLKDGGGLSFWSRWYKERGEAEVINLDDTASWLRQPKSAYEDAKAARVLGLKKGALSDLYEGALGARFLTDGLEAAEQVLRQDLPSDDEIRLLLTEELSLLPALDLSGFSDEESLLAELGDRVDFELELRGLSTKGNRHAKAARLFNVRNTKVENFKKAPQI